MWNNVFIENKNDTHLSDFSHIDNQELVRSVFLCWNFCFDWWDKRNQRMVTINDTFNTRWLNDKELIKVIERQIWIDIRTEEWIEKLNLLFSESVNFLRNVLYKKVWNTIRHRKDNYFSIIPDRNWVIWNDVIKFLRETEKWKRISQTHCRIAKVICSVNDVLENPEIVESEQNAKELIEKQIAPWIIVKDYENLMNYNSSECTIVLDWKIINFRLRFRWKEDASALLKIIYNPDYDESKLLQDPIGMELVCEKEKDIALLFNYFYTTLFWEKINKLSNKWFSIKRMSNYIWISKSFKEELERTTVNKKNITNKDYLDIKILWRNNWLLVEFRWTLKWNKEKDILISDEVYYLWKILLATIRLDWYITESYIKVVINKFYEKYPDMIEKLDKNHLLNYLIKPLIKIDRGSSNLYTSNDRYETLNGTEFYPENFKKVDL